jgi:hypothetical protein
MLTERRQRQERKVSVSPENAYCAASSHTIDPTPPQQFHVYFNLFDKSRRKFELRRRNHNLSRSVERGIHIRLVMPSLSEQVPSRCATSNLSYHTSYPYIPLKHKQRSIGFLMIKMNTPVHKRPGWIDLTRSNPCHNAKTLGAIDGAENINPFPGYLGALTHRSEILILVTRSPDCSLV